MKIYTRTGDAGETGLVGGDRVAKDAARVEAYGSVDELNAALGVARAGGLPEALDELARKIQARLFELGADLATPSAGTAHAVRLPEGATAELEAAIDRCEEDLEPLKTFILPGGHPAGAGLHLARTACRRAERCVIRLARDETIPDLAIPFLNRLSDLLFVMARSANATAGRPELPWKP